MYIYTRTTDVAAIFYPFSHFCEIGVSLPSLQEQPNKAPNIFQRGVEYGKYVVGATRVGFLTTGRMSLFSTQ